MMYKVTVERVVYIEATNKEEAEFFYELGCDLDVVQERVVDVAEVNSNEF